MIQGKLHLYSLIFSGFMSMRSSSALQNVDQSEVAQPGHYNYHTISICQGGMSETAMMCRARF